jgi:hypothetical protein
MEAITLTTDFMVFPSIFATLNMSAYIYSITDATRFPDKRSFSQASLIQLYRSKSVWFQLQRR